MAYLMLELTDGLQKRLAFNISDRAAYLNNGNLCVRGCKIAVKTALNFIGNMGDNLYGASAEISAALLLQDGPVNLTRGNVGIFRQTFVDEALIMSKIQIGLGAVIGNKHFAVLYRIHGTRININIRIKLLHGNFVAACLQQTAQGSCGDAFSKARNYTASDKDVLNWHRRKPPNRMGNIYSVFRKNNLYIIQPVF